MAKSFLPDSGGSLPTGLEAYWRLEEASGNRVDEANGLILTDYNTVTRASGKQGYGAQFVRANTEYLQIANNAHLTFSNESFSIAGWVYFDTLTDGQYYRIFGRWTTGDLSYVLYWFPPSAGAPYGGHFVFGVSSAGGADAYAIPQTTLSPSTWYFVTCIYDYANGKIKMSINNGAFTETNLATCRGGSQAFSVGSEPSGGGNAHNGRIDELGVWRKVLSAQEIADLYNSGNGNTYIERAGDTLAPVGGVATLETTQVAGTAASVTLDVQAIAGQAGSAFLERGAFTGVSAFSDLERPTEVQSPLAAVSNLEASVAAAVGGSSTFERELPGPTAGFANLERAGGQSLAASTAAEGTENAPLAGSSSLERESRGSLGGNTALEANGEDSLPSVAVLEVEGCHGVAVATDCQAESVADLSATTDLESPIQARTSGVASSVALETEGEVGVAGGVALEQGGTADVSLLTSLEVENAADLAAVITLEETSADALGAVVDTERIGETEETLSARAELELITREMLAGSAACELLALESICGYAIIEVSKLACVACSIDIGRVYPYHQRPTPYPTSTNPYTKRSSPYTILP